MKYILVVESPNADKSSANRRFNLLRCPYQTWPSEIDLLAYCFPFNHTSIRAIFCLIFVFYGIDPIDQMPAVSGCPQPSLHTTATCKRTLCQGGWRHEPRRSHRPQMQTAPKASYDRSIDFYFYSLRCINFCVHDNLSVLKHVDLPSAFQYGFSYVAMPRRTTRN